MTVKYFSSVLLLIPLLANGADYHHVHMRAKNTLEVATWYAHNMQGEQTRLGDFDAVMFGEVLLLFAPADREGADGSVAPGELVSSAGSALDHLGFSFVNLATQIPALQAAGARVTRQPENLGTLSYVFIEDPWGQKIEVMQDPQLVGFHHAHLVAVDARAAITWYQEMLGGDVVNFKGVERLPAIRYGSFWIIASGSNNPPTPNMFTMLDHLGWSLRDLDQDLAKIKQSNARILRDSGPLFWWQQWIPFYRGGYLSFVESPDGVTIELLQID